VKLGHSYSGITGSLALNDAGDRQFGSYDFWAICGAGSSAAWKRVAVYRSTADGGKLLVRLPGCDSP
jgi:hypothetical protein